MPRGRPKGWKHTEETKKKLSLILREKTPKGKNHYNWKGGITEESKKIRKSIEYQEWRQKVFERDNYTCQLCGDDKGGNLNAHHIKSFAGHPNLRFDVNNGITYCEICHCRVHDKPYSIRNRRKRRKKTIGITGFYQITEKGIEYLNKRENYKKLPPIIGNPVIQCACGCGKCFSYLDNFGRPRRFISGHNFQSAELQDEILRLLSENAMKVKEITQLTGKPVRSAVCRMRKNGFIEYVKLI